MATRVSELRNGAAKAGTQPSAELDDRMLVLDFQAGNVEVFGEIHRRYAGLARHICQRILGNADDADEATQEAMLRVYQGLSRFNGRYALQPWVARIATNVSLDVTRARTRRPQTGDLTVFDLREELRGHEDDPVETLERGLEREQVNETLATLPQHHREALVLREFEGRSHREIGERLGVTPSQAKALVHRAKGSFRRAWNGGKGLQSFLLILIALARVPHLLRRLFQPAQELAASATAAPAATTSVVTTGERVTAAAVAVLVASSAAVGAVALKQPQGQPKPKPALASPSVQVAAPVTTPERVLAPETRRPESEKTKAKVIPPVVVSPEAFPSPEASQSPYPDPSGSPSPGPSETPLAGPPPAWRLSFRSNVSTDETCGSDCPSSSLISSTVTGSIEENLDFVQVAWGAALDAEGEPAWPLYLQYWGSLGASGGQMSVEFRLRTADGSFRYSGLAVVAETATVDGGTFYRLSGSYRLVEAPEESDAEVPIRGELGATLFVWADLTTLYGADFSLLEV